ncbi:hypothetical protein ABPG74_010921 [Tetrahymena malaccensis]
MCGVSFNAAQTRTNMCVNCLTNQQDITTGITKQGVVNFCRMCKRYNKPPWVYCERESKEMLSLCLKKIKGLEKVKLIDSAFLYTEPHSRRIRIRLTIQKEVMNNTSIQQNFVVEFVEHYGQCDDCKKEFTPHTWGAQVQLRQKVEHKKTFFFLEQVMLKHNAHDKVLKVEEKDDGLDFFYKNKMQANRLVDFIQSVIPCKVKPSKQLIGHDDRNNIYNYKYSWAIEIPKICKDDLCVFPPRLCKELGGISPLVLCVKVSNMLHFVDTHTHKRIDLNAERYFHYENDIIVISLKKNSSEFMVTGIEKIENEFTNPQSLNESSLNTSYMSSISNVYQDKLAHLTLMRTSDWKEFHTKAHLGEIVKEGCMVLGYDLTTLNYSEDLEVLKNAPEVIIVKRIYDKENKGRIWKLKRLQMDGVMVEENTEEANKKNKKKIVSEQDKEQDFEEFMDDIERDPLMREKINLYKNDEGIKKLSDKELARKQQLSRRLKRKMLKVINVKVKDPQEIIRQQEEELQEKLRIAEEKRAEKEAKKKEKEEEEDYNRNEVKLAELLDDLNLEDDQAEDVGDKVFDEDNFIDEFVKRLDHIKIEKQ